MATEADWSHLWLSEGFCHLYDHSVFWKQIWLVIPQRQMLAKDRENCYCISPERGQNRWLIHLLQTIWNCWMPTPIKKAAGHYICYAASWATPFCSGRAFKPITAAYSGKNAVTGDLCKVMSQEVSGKSLTALLSAMVVYCRASQTGNYLAIQCH